MLPVRPFPVCKGKSQIVKVKMAVDGNGKPYKHGDQPKTLPENISVQGNRIGETENVLSVFDTSLATEGHHLYSSTQGKVLIVPREVTPLEDNPKGGRIIYTFKTPVYSIIQVSVFGGSNLGESFILGKDHRNRKFSKFNFPASDRDEVVTVSPIDWLFARELEIVLRGPGAVAEVEVDTCRGGKNE